MRSTSTLLSSLLALCLLLGVTLACSRFRSLTTAKKPADNGGVQLILLVKADPLRLDQSIEKTKSVIQNRCDQLNIYCKLQRQNGDQIMLRFSSSMDPVRVKSVLLSEGLELSAVISEPSPAPVQKYSTREEGMKAAMGKDYDVLPYKERASSDTVSSDSYVIVKREPIVTGEGIRHAEAVSATGTNEEFQILFQLKPDAAEKFGNWTGNNISNYLAIILNNEVQSIAYIKSQILDSGEISGRYTKEQAEDIARILMSGNLPAPIVVLSEEKYKP